MSAGKSGSLNEERDGFEPGTLTDSDMSKLEQMGADARSNGADLTKGEIFDLLKNSRRRSTITYLREHGGSAKLDELAEHIAADENDTTVRQLSSDQRKRVYIGLYQCHLPKMDKLGVVEYDKNRGTVELQESVGQLLQYMELSNEDVEEDTPGRLIPGIAVLVVAIVSIGTLGVGPLSAVPNAGWTLLSILGILVIVFLQ